MIGINLLLEQEVETCILPPTNLPTIIVTFLEFFSYWYKNDCRNSDSITSLSFGYSDTSKVELPCIFFAFQWIGLRFGVGSYFGPLVTNFGSKT